LNVSTDRHIDIGCGSRFQSDIVQGKGDYCKFSDMGSRVKTSADLEMAMFSLLTNMYRISKKQSINFTRTIYYEIERKTWRTL
jgi:hypothetical protein